MTNFIKEILSAQNAKCEKSIYDLLDKITTKYVNKISNIASQICTEKGKKTLNVEHVIEALRQMNFEDHIKKLSSELDLSSCSNEDKVKEIFEDSQEMKDLINQQKKKAKKRKRNIEFTEEMANEQLILFAKAKLDHDFKTFNNQEIPNNFDVDNNGNNNFNCSGDTNSILASRKNLMEKYGGDLFASDNKNEEDFD